MGEFRAPDTDDGPPPFLGSWRNLYIAVLSILALLIIAMYVFSRAFS